MTFTVSTLVKEDDIMGNSATIYPDRDDLLQPLEGRTVAILGYGNQGEAQAQNLRDSGIHTIVGNRADEYRDRAVAADFEVLTIAEAAERADVMLFLIPDEVQGEVFRDQIAPGLKPGNAIVVASGYNTYFGVFDIPAGVDVLMVAPRMIGAGVRSRYVSGEGFPSLVSVEVDGSGHAQEMMLAVAKGIGSGRAAIASSAKEEVALDLFTEQCTFPAIMAVMANAYQALHAAGFSDEAVLSELYLSGEPAEIFQRSATQGLFGQLPLHSRTSQYGQMRGFPRFQEVSDRGAELMHRVLNDEILGGSFHDDWTKLSEEFTEEHDPLADIRDELEKGDLARADNAVRARMSFQ